jgi:predicted O-methyltransferase YrrM
MMNMHKWKLGILAGGLALLAVLVATAQESKKDDKDRQELQKKREALMKKLETTRGRKMNIPPTDGMFVKILAESTRAKRALEIGSSNGYSALWIGQGLENHGGHLWTIEIDAGRAKECRENIKEAELEKTITSIEDDAFKAIPKLEGPFDMVFIDAWKTDYRKFLDLVYPMVRPGGLIIGHNTIESAKDMQDYLDAVNNSPDMDSVTLSTTRMAGGMTVSFKKK